MTPSDFGRRQTPLYPERPLEGPAPASAPPSLLGVLNVLLRGRSLVMVAALLVSAAVIVVTLARPRTYSVVTSFVPQGRATGSNLSGLAAQFGITLQGGEGAQSPQFYVDLLRSREILRGLADTQFAVRTDTGLATGTLADLYRVRAATPALRREKAIDRLRDDVASSVAQKTGVVTLTVTTRSADLSYQIGERMLALLNRYNLETRQSQAAAERRFTEQRLAEVRAELRAAEDRLQAFLQRNRVYRSSPELVFEFERLDREASVRQQLVASLTQAYEQAKIDEVRDTPVITMVERPEIPVRPDRRLLLQKALLGLAVGAVLGIVLVLLRHYLPGGSASASDEAAEFAALRREAVDDLTHPWRPFTRLLRGRRAATF